MTQHFKTFLKVAASAVLLAVASCGSLPKYASTAPDTGPQLSFVDAPVGATVEVDGVQVLTIEKKLKSVGVAPGNHSVLVRSGGAIIYQGSVFIQGQTIKQIKTK
ncbi:MAG: hypothetical protein E6R12_03990 [Sphingomonadales bacterium]|nr:MAG: hypothetical protein E6R12_03990 [Sphingomonadales bacterium]